MIAMGEEGRQCKKEGCFVSMRWVALGSEGSNCSHFKVMDSDHCTVRKEVFHLL